MRAEAAGDQGEPAVCGRRVFRGLLWKEWLAHRNLLLNALGVWIVGVWALPVLNNWLFVLLFGLAYALLAGPAFGGQEAAEGAEEFAFALPPTRSQRYLVRLAVGLGSLAAFTCGASAAVALSLPSKLWGLFVQSGLTEPYPVEGLEVMLVLMMSVPFMVFSLAYMFSALARTRSGVSRAWALSVGTSLLVGFALLSSSPYRVALGGRDLSPSVPFLVGVGALWLGYVRYKGKEGIGRPGEREGWSNGCVWGVVIAIVLSTIMAMITMAYVMAGLE